MINSSRILFVEHNQLFSNMSAQTFFCLSHLNIEEAGLCFASQGNYSVHRVIVTYTRRREAVTCHTHYNLCLLSATFKTP